MKPLSRLVDLEIPPSPRGCNSETNISVKVGHGQLFRVMAKAHLGRDVFSLQSPTSHPLEFHYHLQLQNIKSSPLTLVHYPLPHQKSFPKSLVIVSLL